MGSGCAALLAESAGGGGAHAVNQGREERRRVREQRLRGVELGDGASIHDDHAVCGDNGV
eukprot:CAMPEP_0202824504 /NCGR_PEP_ID=MMETSP1389-20130828/12401_1 /ASSEMBLY_ACC=CAM_ASM_000865 /TAXON_ID=302021 /ORGANISM="Rhodomonas sp., Strain CCMP768" /LENGTH=59 /DNA_ID=CAMNT_0049497609 /DNA_START=128 /DNA_END=307 /DNA_ORIENTATION=+